MLEPTPIVPPTLTEREFNFLVIDGVIEPVIIMMTIIVNISSISEKAHDVRLLKPFCCMFFPCLKPRLVGGWVFGLLRPW